MLISIVLLVTAGVLSAGVFLYKSMATKESENKMTALERSQNEFQPALIKEFQKLSNRIQVAEAILDNHIAPSAFLYALEKDTLTGVQFSEFKFKYKNNDIAEFSLKGKTASVNSVALQSTLFSDSDIIKQSIFSDIDLINGGVTFNVEGEIDLNAIRFANVVAEAFSANDQEHNPVDNQRLDSDLFFNNDLLNQSGDFGNFE
jgi:hypothetical protein